MELWPWRGRILRKERNISWIRSLYQGFLTNWTYLAQDVMCYGRGRSHKMRHNFTFYVNFQGNHQASVFAFVHKCITKIIWVTFFYNHASLFSPRLQKTYIPYINIRSSQYLIHLSFKQHSENLKV